LANESNIIFANYLARDNLELGAAAHGRYTQIGDSA
jgi:hypothetical protein